MFTAVPALATPLDDYVDAADSSYTFSITNTSTGTGYTLYTVAMTSQTWRIPSEVDHNAWQHNMRICVPDNVTSNKALLTISGGSHGSTPGVDTNLAVSTGSVVAAIANVPNQPLTFAGESFYRYEDEIIAKTGRLYMDGGDDYWPLLIPMVKSATSAMDTISSVAFDEKGVTVNKFVLTGVSKRGWTTWLTAAADSRVCAIAPAVINVLNMDEQMKYTKKVFEGVTQQVVGGYPQAVQDYVNEGVFDDLDSQAFQDMLQIIDPYEYRDRLTMPKLMINATGDEFFVPDSCKNFLSDIPGQNYLRFQPNMGHGVNSDGYTTLTQFYDAIVNDTELPDFSWSIQPDGSIRITTVDTPTEVKLWQATNPLNRDFRQNVSGTTWTSSVLTEYSPGVYIASVPLPSLGYTAFMAEMTYNVSGELMTFTTEVNVIPEPGMIVLLLIGLTAMLSRRPKRA
ncbi:MAG: PEP-CTERM sorting domain-containing protein [Pirellulales bacterium]|nr:PEP-CTERM sorting domain-containing protein [Pirellulales bacterium]